MAREIVPQRSTDSELNKQFPLTLILSAILFAAGDQRLTAENRTVRVNQQSIISQCLVKQNLAN